MNPSVDKAVIAEAYEDDPASARAEYGAQFRDDLIDYVSAETIAALTMIGRSELPPMADVTYSAFVDASAGRNDSMTLAIGHLSANGICVLDLLLEARPPFDPEVVVAQFAIELRRYGIASLVGDKFGGEWVVQSFARHGIELVQSAKPKSDIYADFLFLINAARIELLDNLRLARELTGLERRTARSGRDSIDHMPGGHDDLANAVAGLLVGLDLDRRPQLVQITDVAGDDKRGVELPAQCQYVYLMVVNVGVDVAAVFCASNLDDPCLYILDVDVRFFQPGLFGELALRLHEMMLERHAVTAQILAPEPLAVQLGPRVVPLPKDFDPEILLLKTSEYIHGGSVKLCAPVIARMQSKAIAAALALRADDEVATALRAGLIAACWVKYARPA
jgi:hypothetical protein